MNQLIKKLFILLILSNSLIVWGATYYFNSPNHSSTGYADASNLSNWSTTKGGGGTTATNFTTAGDIFDFNGSSSPRRTRACFVSAVTVGNVTFQNSNSQVVTVYAGTYVSSGTGTASIITINSATPPTFSNTNITYTFNNFGTIRYSSGNADILGIAHNNIIIDDGIKTIKNPTTINGTLECPSVLANTTILIANTLTLATTFNHASSPSNEIDLTTNGEIIDNRTTRIFQGRFFHSITSKNVLSAEYYVLNVRANTSLGGDIKVTNGFQVGNSGLQCVLNLNGYKLTTNTLLFGAPSGSNYNKINAANTNSTIEFNQSSSTPIELFATNFGSSTTSIGPIYHLKISSSGSTSSVEIKDSLTVSNSITLNGVGVLKINGKQLRFNGTNIYRNAGSSGISANGAGSTMIFSNPLTNATVTIDKGSIPIVTNLKVALPNGGSVNLTPTEAMTISGDLDMSQPDNFFNIESTKLVIEGTITNTRSASGSKFIGGYDTNLEIYTSGTVGTLYFDDTDPRISNLISSLSIQDMGSELTLGNELYIASTGFVEVLSTSTLNCNGNLILSSDIDGTASILASDGIINGEYTAESFIPATGRKYRFLSSPVVGGTALEWRDNGNNTAGRGLQITGNNPSTNGFDASTTNNPSAFYYDETSAGSDTSLTSGNDDSGWKTFSSGDASMQLENGTGYRVLVRGDRKISLFTNPSPSANETTIWVKGSYPGYSSGASSSQSIVKNLSYTSSAGNNKGINLIGNPYPCTLDWNAVSKGTNVDAGYMIYDPGVTGKGWTAAPRYRAYNGTTGGAGKYISSGQGFLVYTSSNTNNTITFEETDKVSNPGGGFFAEKLTDHLILSFIYDSVYYDESYLHFRPDAIDYKDRFDVFQLLNPTVNIATYDSSGKSYNINSLSKLEEKRNVFLNISNNPSAEYKIKFNDVGTFANHRIYLKDNYKNSTVEIFEGKAYAISINNDPLSKNNTRLELIFEPIAASLKKIDKMDLIMIEENPIAEKLVLKKTFSTVIGNASIKIINTSGQIIDTQIWLTDKDSNFEYNANYLTSGLYFIKIESKNYYQTIKFNKL